MILPDIAEIFEKKKDQDIVFVFGWINHTAEGIAGFPESVVDLRL